MLSIIVCHPVEKGQGWNVVTMDDEARRRMRQEMAAELGVPLYRRFPENAAAGMVGVTVEELRDLRLTGAIGYVRLTEQKAAYFGFQLLDYLIEAIRAPQSADVASARRTTSERLSSLPSSNAAHPILLSVRDAAAALGIGRSKLYELIADGPLEVVHLGRRTLVTAASVRRLGAAAD